MKISLFFTTNLITAELPLIACLLTAIKLYSVQWITTTISGRNTYAGEMFASSCNSKKCYFSLMWAHKAPDQCLVSQIYGV